MAALAELLAIPVVQVILHHEGKVYGGVVREACGRDPDLVAYLQRARLLAYVPRGMRRVCDRGLHAFTVSGPFVAKDGALATVCEYEVRAKGEDTVRLQVSYVSEYQIVQRVGTRDDVDVNCLQVDRTGLTLRVMPPLLEHHPCPIASVLESCRRRTLHLLRVPTCEADEAFVLERIHALSLQGWTNGDARVGDAGEVDDDATCAICLEDTPDAPWLRIMPCGHVFHRECLQGFAVESTRRQPLYPRTIKCPLCRDAVPSYALCPAVLLSP